MNTTTKEVAPRNLAKMFVLTLRRWLSEEEWCEMVRLNIAEPNRNICHSHDFCDANMAMLAAYCELTDTPEDDVDIDAVIPLFDEAWKLAEPWIRREPVDPDIVLSLISKLGDCNRLMADMLANGAHIDGYRNIVSLRIAESDAVLLRVKP